MQVPNYLLQGSYLAALRTINSRTTMTVAELDAFPGITSEMIHNLRQAKLLAVLPLAPGAHVNEQKLRLTTEAVSVLNTINRADREAKNTAAKPAATVADIISAVSKRSIQIDQDTKRTMTALLTRLGLSSLEDVLTVALVMTNTLLDVLPSDGVLRLVNEDGESIQTLKITP